MNLPQQTQRPQETQRPPRLPPQERTRTGVGTAFGTFGELLQGVLPERDGDFLVTLPVARWTMATFRQEPHAEGVVVRPPRKTKARRLAAAILAESPHPAQGLLTLHSAIPEGKGMASSSADLVATARAVAHAVGAEMPNARIERLLRRLEPTDGVLYPAIVAFHHRAVRLRAVLGPLPAMGVVGIDEGGSVDTLEFNRIPKPFTLADQHEYARLLSRLTAAVRRHDLPEVGRVATRSAVMNQPLRKKRFLEPLCEICRDVGGLGVAVGHSGTTLGILLDAADPAYTHRVTTAAQACSELAGNVAVHRTLSFPQTRHLPGSPGRAGADDMPGVRIVRSPARPAGPRPGREAGR